MIYVLYKEGLEPFKTTYWNAADIKVAQGWTLMESYKEDLAPIPEIVIEQPKSRRKRVNLEIHQ